MGLQKHANNMGICTEICWAVRNLAPFEGNRERYTHNALCHALMFSC